MSPELRLSVPLAAVVAAAMLLSSVASSDQAPWDALPWGYAAVLPIAVWTAVAWRCPRLSVVAAPMTAYLGFATVLPAFPDVLALAVPLVVVGLRGRPAWGVATAVVVTCTSVGYRLFVEGEATALGLAVDVVRDSALMLALLLLGDSIRARRAARHEAELETRVREGEHQARLAAQRLETARELHDVLAHTLTLVRIQSSVVEEALDDPASARDAVLALRRTTGDALADLRGTVEVLRTVDPEPSAAPAPGLEEVDQLVAVARSSGLDARLDVTGDLATVRPALGLAAYRLVQEAITNTLRHAGATRVEVGVRHDATGVHVRVTDDGTAAPRAAGDRDAAVGYGLSGMRERVVALGGRLAHGPRTDAPGFEVLGWFPGERDG